MSEPAQAARISRKRKLIYSLAVAAVVLAALELVFRGLGLFAPERPFSVFIDPEGALRVRYNYNDLNPPFAKARPANVFRIMIAGGSTAMGFPYHPRSSFGKRLAVMLQDSFPGRKIEVINLSRWGMDSSGVAQVLGEAVEFEPDLVIVISGHNEFISAFAFPLTRGLGRNLFRLRVANAAMAGVRMVLGGAFLATVRGFEEDPGSAIELPAPSPITASEFQAVIDQYRDNLERIRQLMRSRNVSLVLCTLPSNLKDWPPDWRALPAGMSQDHAARVRSDLERARVLTGEGRFAEALVLIKGGRAMAQKFAFATFVSGRLKQEMLIQGAGMEGGGDGLDREALRREARSEFQQALSQEAAVVVSHRAPPAINDVVRESAEREGAWLFDAQAMFRNLSSVSPGFDWFSDHCHPNLEGQQAMAEALFNLLREKGLPGPAEQWRDLPPWDEDRFRAAAGIDQAFLHGVELRMGIFLGLQKDLPDQSAETRKRFRQAAVTDPADPLPPLLSALVSLYYGDTAQATAQLVPWYGQKRTDLEKCLGRYASDAVDLRQGVFMARLEQTPGLPPLRGLLRTGLFKQGKERVARPQKPLEYFSVFLDLENGGRVITDMIQARANLFSPDRPGADKGPLVLLDPDRGIALSPGKGARLVKVGANVTYQIDSAWGFLTSGPVSIDPVLYDQAELRYPAGTPAGWPRLAWSFKGAAGEQGYAEAEPLPVENRPGTLRLTLSDQPRWVAAREVTEIMLIPGVKKGRVDLKGLVLSR